MKWRPQPSCLPRQQGIQDLSRQLPYPAGMAKADRGRGSLVEPADAPAGKKGLPLGAVPGDRAESVDDEGDELVAGHRPDLVEPSQ